MTPRDEHREDLTDEQIADLGTLLQAERPRPSEAFATRLDARVAARFAAPASAPQARRTWIDALRRPFLLPAAATVAVALVALVVVLGGGTEHGGTTLVAPSQSAPDTAAEAPAVQDQATDQRAAAGAAPEIAPSGADAGAGADAGTTAADGRKVERSASLELATAGDRVDDVAQDVLGVVARFDGIVDQSSISSGTTAGEAHFALRVPTARLQPALAALSRIDDAKVLARTDDAVDVNQAYVSVRRRLANARAERTGVLRALRAADSEDETLRLRARLDALERTIALTERSQRALERRVDYATVAVSVRADTSTGDGAGTAGPFTIGRAAHDALRVLEVAAGVVVIAAAALVPLLALLACAWPLARALTRRRREHALDAAV